eukprot:gene2905-3357_t
MESELSLNSPTYRFPLLAKHFEAVFAGTLKGIKLVQGWKITSAENVYDDEGNLSILDHWECREKQDVKHDLQIFIRDIIASFESRIADNSKKMLHVLASLDLDTIFGFLCGKRLKNGKIKLFLGEAELQRYGKDDFDKFFAYVCSSDHIKKFCFKEDEREIQEDETGNTEKTTTGNLVKLELSQYSEKKPYCLGNVTKLDWCLPPVIQSVRAVDRIEKVYIGSDKEASIPKHILSILGDRAKYAGDGSVLKRLQETKSVGLPFRL